MRELPRLLPDIVVPTTSFDALLLGFSPFRQPTSLPAALPNYRHDNRPSNPLPAIRPSNHHATQTSCQLPSQQNILLPIVPTPAVPRKLHYLALFGHYRG
jgi:hypothetical protein